VLSLPQAAEVNPQADLSGLILQQPPAQGTTQINFAQLGRINELVAQRDLLEFRVLFLQQLLVQNGIAIPQIDNIGVKGIPRTTSAYPKPLGKTQDHAVEQSTGNTVSLAHTAQKAQAFDKTNLSDRPVLHRDDSRRLLRKALKQRHTYKNPPRLRD
jgi:hypothetical protein